MIGTGIISSSCCSAGAPAAAARGTRSSERGAAVARAGLRVSCRGSTREILNKGAARLSISSVRSGNGARLAKLIIRESQITSEENRRLSVAISAASSEDAGSASSSAGKAGEGVARATEAGEPEEKKEEEERANGFKTWWAKASKIDKSTIAALGGAALLSYGFVSNVFYVSSLLLATYTSVKTCGVSPLVSKEAMKLFATTYFGLWMIQNFLRPARMALSVAISPWTDKLVEFFRQYVPGNKKPLAFGLTVGTFR